MSSKSIITVLVVDDHALVRAGIRKLLEETDDIKIIDEAGHGEEAMQKVRDNPKCPDIVLLDITMPGMSGIELTRRLIKMKPQIKIIALTSHEEEFFPAQLLKMGALGYLTKGTITSELIKAIRTVARNNQRFIVQQVAEQMAAKYIEGNFDSPFEKLSNRELEILLMITQGKKVADIAAKLFISAKTVNTYRYRLFEKLNVQNDVELTKLSLQYGLINIEQS